MTASAHQSLSLSLLSLSLIMTGQRVHTSPQRDFVFSSFGSQEFPKFSIPVLFPGNVLKLRKIEETFVSSFFKTRPGGGGGGGGEQKSCMCWYQMRADYRVKFNSSVALRYVSPQRSY